ncbi:MAG: hypothetical protein A4S09_01280 [Proteobacteria bacterium SG_bin7]|nr:MAG: hypothetical protein A4S09_01280 [Proteobacteria bacterium SG_bin7]
MAFDQDFIERVRNAHNIVDYISSFTQLKRSGSTYMGLCPFPSHREKTPSFSVSEDKQIYHCFGCQKGGNLITFLIEYQGMSFPQAIETLANKAGILIPEKANPESAKKRDEKNQLYSINALAKDSWAKELKKLPPTSPVKAYLKKRGLSEEIVSEFELGWATDSWNFMVQALVKNKIQMNVGESAGLVRRKDARFYDYFRSRLMFPIIANTGEVLGFGGRGLRDEDTPKYLNSPDTPLFHKGKVLFGLNHSAKHIRAEDQVIVVEGYMDFLALYQAGIKNVVAVLGTALTHDHCRLLQRFSKNVLVLFDGDSAGIRAAERSLAILLSNDLLPKWCLLPDDFDPDEYIQERGKPAFQEALQKSEEMFLGLLTFWMKNFSYQNYEKIQIVQKVAPILHAIKNQALRELYLNELCLRLRVENSWLLKALDQNKQQTTAEINPTGAEKQSTEQATKTEKVNLEGLSRAELDLMGLMLKSAEYIAKLDQEKVSEISSQGFAKVVSLAKNYLEHFPDDFNKLAGYISSMVDTPSIVTHYEKRSSSYADAKTAHKLFVDCVNWIRSQKYKEKAKEMHYKLQQNATPQELEQFMNINKKKHGILGT